VLHQACADLRRAPGFDPRLVARVLASLAIVEFLLGEAPVSIELARQGLAVAELEKATASEERLFLYHTLGTIYYRSAAYEQADAELNAALAELKGRSERARHAALIHVQAGVARGRGHFAKALALLEPLLAEPLLPSREKALIALQAAHVLLDLGDFRGAAQRYRTVASWFREPDRDGVFERAMAGASICCSQLGLLGEAEAYLTDLRRSGPSAPGYDVLLAEGMLLLQRGAAAQAADCFARASVIPGTPAGKRDRLQARHLAARALLRQGRSAAAAALVADDDAVNNIPGEKPVLPEWIRLPVAGLLRNNGNRVDELASADDREAAPARATSPRLLHALQDLATTDKPPPRTIELRLFGPPRLLVDGAEVALRGIRHKATEILWYAALHPDGFTGTDAQSDLYPDLDATASYRPFHVALAVIRRALSDACSLPGGRLLVRRTDGTYQLDLAASGAAVTVDTAALGALSEALRKNPRLAPPTPLPDLFRGELLAGVQAEWLDAPRRYWSTVYLRALGTLADRYARQGDPQGAIRCHELALQLDPTLADSHTALFRLFHAAGDRPALDAQIWLFRTTSRDELAASPDPEVEALIHDLTS
jgi:tetratricopeptide (TPR) repeat protein